MRIVITGATGFIGRALVAELLEAGYDVTCLSRSVEKAGRILGPDVKTVRWDGKTVTGWVESFENAFGVVNLAGESIGTGRWTERKKRLILQSRVDTTNAVAEAIKKVRNKPKVVIQASGIGYYGTGISEQVDESSPRGCGFLAELSEKWEACTNGIKDLGIRCVFISTGIVLGRDGGALPELMRPFYFYLGGWPGTGKQWFSWISLADEVAAIRFLMENKKLHGPFNLTSPEPVRMKDFCRATGKALRKPCWTALPACMLHIFYGQMADELILSGRQIIPKRLLQAGFNFRFKKVEDTLRHILK